MGFKSALHRFAEKAKQPFHRRPKTCSTSDVDAEAQSPESDTKRSSIRVLKVSLKKRFSHLGDQALEIGSARAVSIQPMHSESMLAVHTDSPPTPSSPVHSIPESFSPISARHSIARKPVRTPSQAPKIVLHPTPRFECDPDTRLLEYAKEVEYRFTSGMTKDEVMIVLLCLWLADQKPSDENILPFLTITGPLPGYSPYRRVSKPMSSNSSPKIDVVDSPSISDKGKDSEESTLHVESSVSSICTHSKDHEGTQEHTVEPEKSMSKTTMSITDKKEIKELRALAFMAVSGDKSAHAEIIALYEPLVRRPQIATSSPNDCTYTDGVEDALGDLDDDSEILEYSKAPPRTPGEWDDSEADDDSDDSDDISDIIVSGQEVGTEEDATKYHKEWVIRKAGLVLELHTLVNLGLLNGDVFDTIKKNMFPKDEAEERNASNENDEFCAFVCKNAAEGVLDDNQEMQLLAFGSWGPVDKPEDWDVEVVEKPEPEEENTTSGGALQEASVLQAIGSLDITRHGRPIKPMRKRRMNAA